MIDLRRGALAAVLLALATAASAGPSDLVKCDGYGARVGTGEAVVRATMIIATLGIIGSREPDNPSARLEGQAGIVACTAALVDPRVTGNPVRRAEVLLMRAMRNLEDKQPRLAQADVDAMRAVDIPPAQRVAFDRSLGVSAALAEAYVRLADDRQGEAEAAALKAFQSRPWDDFVADRAQAVLALSPQVSPGEAALFEQLVRINPNRLVERAGAHEANGEWRAAADDLATRSAIVIKPNIVERARQAADLALAGDAAAADTLLTATQQLIDEEAARASGTDAEAQKAALAVARADELVQLARAQLALGAGRLDEARTLLGGRQRWLAPAPLVAQVLIAAHVRLGPGGAGSLAADPAKLVADAVRTRRSELIDSTQLRLLAPLLPRWEDSQYARLGRTIFGPSGSLMKTEPSPDRRALRVTLTDVRATTGTAGEAIAVAAARAAAAAGKDRFAVVAIGRAIILPRSGIGYSAVVWDIITPGDPLWSGQQARAVAVADIDHELEPLFPKPAPVGH